MKIENIDEFHKLNDKLVSIKVQQDQIEQRQDRPFRVAMVMPDDIRTIAVVNDPYLCGVIKLLIVAYLEEKRKELEKEIEKL